MGYYQHDYNTMGFCRKCVSRFSNRVRKMKCLQFLAVSIFITHDVIFHCYSSRNKSVYTIFNTWVSLSLLHTGYKDGHCPSFCVSIIGAKGETSSTCCRILQFCVFVSIAYKLDKILQNVNIWWKPYSLTKQKNWTWTFGNERRIYIQ